MLCCQKVAASPNIVLKAIIVAVFNCIEFFENVCYKLWVGLCNGGGRGS